MRSVLSLRAAGACLVLASGLVHADSSLASALSGGKTNLDIQLRLENVERGSPLNDDANALTARARLGYSTATWNSLDAVLEYEGTFDFSDGAYNSTLNGNTQRSVVADPAGTELNQAFLRFTGLPATTIKLGRQRLIYDNARFVGNVGWRQNEQTFDAISLTNTTIDQLRFNYAYLTGVNTITFGSVDLDAHLINAQYALSDALKISAYGYALDYASGTDSQTLGLRLSGTADIGAGISYVAEYAKQSDYADAAQSVDADYMLASLGTKVGPVNANLSYAVLGSNDGQYAFQTPLATKHAFQGWADLFLATPANGLQDLFLTVSGKWSGTTLKAIYHQFDADFGSEKYGSEIDLVAVKPLSPSLKAVLKLADYQADSFGVDTRKIWLMLNWKL